jgi:dihydrofolate synthase/folylpolyglutamate synthase
LGELAEDIFGASRVTVVPRLDDAIERAVAVAEADVVGSSGVLISGSVIAISEARTLLVKDEPMVVPAARESLDDQWDSDYSEDGHETDWDWR